MTLKEMEGQLEDTPYPTFKAARKRSFAAGYERARRHANWRAAGVGMKKADIRNEYELEEETRMLRGQPFLVRETSGWWGDPKYVERYRDQSAQTELSGGTGLHAGHRAGTSFGGPGDGTNLDLTSIWLNLSGYVKHFENRVRVAFRLGKRAYATAEAVYKPSGKYGRQKPVSVRVNAYYVDPADYVVHERLTLGNFPDRCKHA